MALNCHWLGSTNRQRNAAAAPETAQTSERLTLWCRRCIMCCERVACRHLNNKKLVLFACLIILLRLQQVCVFLTQYIGSLLMFRQHLTACCLVTSFDTPSSNYMWNEFCYVELMLSCTCTFVYALLYEFAKTHGGANTKQYMKWLSARISNSS